jgi:hypothetical protein
VWRDKPHTSLSYAAPLRNSPHQTKCPGHSNANFAAPVRSR